MWIDSIVLGFNTELQKDIAIRDAIENNCLVEDNTEDKWFFTIFGWGYSIEEDIERIRNMAKKVYSVEEDI